MKNRLTWKPEEWCSRLAYCSLPMGLLLYYFISNIYYSSSEADQNTESETVTENEYWCAFRKPKLSTVYLQSEFQMVYGNT